MNGDKTVAALGEFVLATSESTLFVPIDSEVFFRLPIIDRQSRNLSGRFFFQSSFGRIVFFRSNPRFLSRSFVALTTASATPASLAISLFLLKRPELQSRSIFFSSVVSLGAGRPGLLPFPAGFFRAVVADSVSAPASASAETPPVCRSLSSSRL